MNQRTILEELEFFDVWRESFKNTNISTNLQNLANNCYNMQKTNPRRIFEKLEENILMSKKGEKNFHESLNEGFAWDSGMNSLINLIYPLITGG